MQSYKRAGVVSAAARFGSLGSPLERRNKPANRFVAYFTGSHRMNLSRA